MVLNMWTQGGSRVWESCGTFARWDPTAGSGSCSRVGGLEFITLSCLWSTLCLHPDVRSPGHACWPPGYLPCLSATRGGTHSNHEPKWILPPLSCPCDYLVTARRKLTNTDVKLRFSERRNAIIKQQLERQSYHVIMTDKISDRFTGENIQEQQQKKNVPSLVTPFSWQLFPFNNELCARSKQYEIHS